MRQNNEKSIDKIRKLLALASSPNEHEAQSALLKAQELLAKHNLSMSDIGNIEQEEEVVEFTIDAPFSKMKWRYLLASVIADNFRCYCWGVKDRASNGYCKKVTFLGKESDVEVCKTMYTYARKFIESNIRRMQRELNSQGYNSKGVASSYGIGFCRGLEKQFEEQLKAHQEWGLVLSKPHDVIKAYEAMSSGFMDKKLKASSSSTYYNKGFDDGKKFTPNAVTTSKQQSQLLLGQ